MRQTTILCDKCSTTITGGHSIMTITFIAGELTKTRDDPLDLCQSCASELIGWLKADAGVRDQGFALESSDHVTTRK